MGHSEKFCERLFDTMEGEIKRNYGADLRAMPRRKNHTMGAKWLRSGAEVRQRGIGGEDGSREVRR